jgi:thiamine biosynthesis lipoprotein
MSASVATRTMPALGTTVTVAVTEADLADRALALLAEDLVALDEACSRFRPDSELSRVEQSGRGRPVEVSALLFEALEVAAAVAQLTAGIVDPTVGSALVALGYDRDFDQLGADVSLPAGSSGPAPGWWRIALDADRRTVAIPDGVHVDLGSTAKAFAADRAARRLAAELRCGVLVNLGGDVAVSGAVPAGGWAVGIAPECTTSVHEVDQVVAITTGGLATSGTTARSWVRDGRRIHHIIDPWTGEPAPAVWSLVSVSAPSCVEANAWSTAAVVWAEDAVGNLAAHGACARLVRADGDVVRVGGWPDDAAPSDAAQDDVAQDHVAQDDVAPDHAAPHAALHDGPGRAA